MPALSALGAIVDVEGLSLSGEFHVKSKPERKASITSNVEKMVKEGVLELQGKGNVR